MAYHHMKGAVAFAAAMALSACGGQGNKEQPEASPEPTASETAAASEMPEAISSATQAASEADAASEATAASEAVGAPKAAATPEAASAAATPSKPPVAFFQCASCHSVEPGRNGIGPSLHDVFGHKAGSVAGFSYSEPLKASGLTWDAATLDKWLANPRQTVPGTRMIFPGIPDPARRQEIIDYLETLK